MQSQIDNLFVLKPLMYICDLIYDPVIYYKQCGLRIRISWVHHRLTRSQMRKREAHI